MRRLFIRNTILVSIFYLFNKYLLYNLGVEFFSLERTHGFVFGLTILTCLVLEKIKQRDKERIGLAFLTLSVLKSVAVVLVLFLTKTILVKHEVFQIINFFTVYFFYLFLEVEYILFKIKN